MIRGVFIDPDVPGPSTIREIDSPGDLPELLRAVFIDVATFSMDGVIFDIWADDDGLSADDLRPSVMYRGKARVYGPVFICRADDMGESISLTIPECFSILAHTLPSQVHPYTEILHSP